MVNGICRIKTIKAGEKKVHLLALFLIRFKTAYFYWLIH